MYNTPGITTGISGGAGVAALAVTGVSTFAYVALAMALVIGGLLLVRSSRFRRDQHAATGK